MAAGSRLSRARGTLGSVRRAAAMRAAPRRHGAAALACSWKLAGDRSLADWLGLDLIHPALAAGRRPAAALGWGRRPSGRRASALAAARGLDCILLEDGPLRSIGRHDPALSLMIDRIGGVYYDAHAPSALEASIPAPLSAAEAARAAALAEAWVAGGVSKYNHAPDYAGDLPERFVLLVDQVARDMSITRGMAGPKTFQRMLEAALDEHPGARVLVKLHPDVRMSGKAGHFDLEALARIDRVTAIADGSHPVRLLAGAETVYAATSQMGFEALLHGTQVRCFGMPFYAGWGLTADELSPPSRRGSASLAQVTHALLVGATLWRDPATGAATTPERAIAHVAAHRRGMAGG